MGEEGERTTNFLKLLETLDERRREKQEEIKTKRYERNNQRRRDARQKDHQTKLATILEDEIQDSSEDVESIVQALKDQEAQKLARAEVSRQKKNSLEQQRYQRGKDQQNQLVRQQLNQEINRLRMRAERASLRQREAEAEREKRAVIQPHFYFQPVFFRLCPPE